MAVSYTHLDVYKRQLQLGLGAVQFGALLRLERGGLFVFGAHLPLLLFELLDSLPL